MSAALIIEPLRSGHHLTYLIEIVRGAVARGVDVVVAAGADANGDVIVDRLRCEFPVANFPIVRVPTFKDRSTGLGPFGLLRRAFRWWRFLGHAYRAAIKFHRVDFVFVPYLDNALFAISLFGSPFEGAPFAGISMAQTFHLPQMGVRVARQKGSNLRERLFFKLLRMAGLKALYVIDDTLEGFVVRKHPSLRDKVRYIPDPIVPPQPADKTAARDALKLPRDAPLIVVYGVLDGRKGIRSLLEWLADAGNGSNAAVLLAGTLRNETRRLLEGEAARRLLAQRRLHLLSKYVDEQAESLIFSAADVVWLAYDAVESSSGVMVKAALFEKAVLYRDFGLIGRYATRFGSATSAADLRVPPLPRGVQLCVFARGAKSAEPFPDHSWDNACNRIFGLLAPRRQATQGG
jgi:hypothetical protein